VYTASSDNEHNMGLVSAASWVTKSIGGAGRCNFSTDLTAANFRQRISWVLKFSILPLNFLTMGVSAPHLFFGRTFSDNPKF